MGTSSPTLSHFPRWSRGPSISLSAYASFLKWGGHPTTNAKWEYGRTWEFSPKGKEAFPPLQRRGLHRVENMPLLAGAGGGIEERRLRCSAGRNSCCCCGDWNGGEEGEVTEGFLFFLVLPRKASNRVPMTEELGPIPRCSDQVPFWLT